MKKEIKNLLSTLLEVKEIELIVEKFKITQKEMVDVLPTLLLIMEESQMDDKPDYLVSLSRSITGELKRVFTPSPKGLKKIYVSNILTQDITPINTEITISHFDKTPERQELGKHIVAYFKGDSSKGLYIYGPVGVGKSFISQAIANKIAQSGKKIAFINLAEFITTLKSRFGSFDDSVMELSNKLKTVDVLFIDDIGAETITEWFRDEHLLGILSSRMNNDKTTFFTSNYSYDELEKKEAKVSNGKNKYMDYDKASRLLERIKALTKPVAIGGKNRRY